MLECPASLRAGGALGRRLATEWRPCVETVWKPSVPAAAKAIFLWTIPLAATVCGGMLLACVITYWIANEIRGNTGYTRGCALFSNEGVRLDR
jgi:hypothetical protein